MVIIPTEKRFDWQHTPIVLFSILLINVLVFIVYQSGDYAKFQWALEEYQKHNYLSIEWPFVEKYFIETDEIELLEDLEQLHDEQRYQELSMQLLLRLDFYQYLRVDQYEYFQLAQVGDWFFKREEINNRIASTSFFAFGLTPTALKISAFITYQFLHGDIMHLLGNMFFLVICGFAVEAAIGRWRFLLFYLLTGIAGGLLHVALNLKETLPLVGASGSVSGVMAMYLGIFRLKKIEFFYWFFVFVGYFRAPALMILPLYIGNELYQYINDTESQVAFMAHIGGFLAGGLLAAAAIYFKPDMFNREYIEEDQSANPYQEQLAKVYDLIEKYRFPVARRHLNTIIQEHGVNFDLALLRYNIEKIDKDGDYADHLMQLLKTANPDPTEITKIEKIWLENPEYHGQVDQETAVKLGLHFATLSDPTTAAGICDRLLADGYKQSSVGVLAGKLANRFGKQDNLAKQRKYDTIAQTLLATNH